MSYAIMRIAKMKAGNISGCQKHNERENKNYSNEDINKDLSHLNYNLVECESYKGAINKEIKERYKSNRSIRKDAVLGVEVLFTSDREFFDKLTPEEEKKYFEKSLEFLKNFVGEKNVISATVHKDETTPHMHCVFTPIDEHGNLKFKSFINGRNDLIKMQDSYHKFISKDFNLERGKSVVETKQEHLSVTEFKLQTAINQKELELEKVNQATEEIEKRKEKLKSEDEKLYKLEEIKREVKEKKNIFSKKVVVEIEKHQFDSLMKYARESEENFKKLNKLEEDIETLKNSNLEYTRRARILSNENDKLSVENIKLKEEIFKHKKNANSLKENLQELGYLNAFEECLLYQEYKNSKREKQYDLGKKIKDKMPNERNRAEEKIAKEFEKVEKWLNVKKDFGIER